MNISAQTILDLKKSVDAGKCIISQIGEGVEASLEFTQENYNPLTGEKLQDTKHIILLQTLDEIKSVSELHINELQTVINAVDALTISALQNHP